MSGQCAKCESENIIYGGFELVGEYGFYEYTCQDCNHDGKEYYNLEYDESE